MLSKAHPNKTSEWKKLEAMSQAFSQKSLKEIVKNEVGRADRFCAELNSVVFDYSRAALDREILELLLSLAKTMELPSAIEAMFRGEPINETERRSVLHTALRSRSTDALYVDSHDVRPDIRAVLDRMKRFSEKVLSGTHRSWTGGSLRKVINIGIGGSDLGPAMVYEALKSHRKSELEVFYVSNVDGAHLAPLLAKLKPEECLFIIASKTFTTQETMANAEAAKRWMLENGMPESAARFHFCAVSTNLEAVQAFGIDPENMFEFWDWVGGRYSLWSAIGLSLCLGLGFDRFEELLRGAESADEHFRTADFDRNIPVLMGMMGIWYRNFLDFRSYAVLPYDQNLSRFSAFLQQADMESNGKMTGRDGKPLEYATAPVIWGEPGTNGQHAFYQCLHQGSDRVPVDFIGCVEPMYALGDQHSMLLANMLAQAEAFMNGLSAEEAVLAMRKEGLSEQDIVELTPFRVFEGNRPSNTLLLPRLDPYYLGMLTALYEHKIFVQGVVWNIFSFDQWGVELGKRLAKPILNALIKNDLTQVKDEFTRKNLERISRARPR